MRARTLSIALCCACLALPIRAETAANPPTLALAGSTTLPRAAEARRLHLLGAVELYRVAIYADGPTADRARLASEDVAKAIRIVITYRADLHHPVTLDWTRELIPAIEPAGAAHLRGAFAALREGDAAVIAYVPGKGTSIVVNRAVVVDGAEHELMLAFLDHWIGQRPVSEALKQDLLGR